jgi:ubiquinol-cytochrome c reductase cytochrome b subunit
MFASLLILLILPVVDLARTRGSQFRPFMRFINWVFFVNFGLLFWIGSQHPEQPYVIIGQISTVIYFSYFLLFVPAIGLIENTLMDLSLNKVNSTKTSN